MATISQKIHNYNYAPGIATYGRIGKTGDNGANGSNVFFTNISLSNNTELKILVSLIINNYMPIKNDSTVLNRPYQDGDCFFNMEGLIYMLYNINDLIKDGTTDKIGRYPKYFNLVGRITVDTASYLNYINNSNRLELNPDYKGFDIVTVQSTDVTPHINLEVAMNIVSDNLDEYNNINFILMTAVNSYNSINGQLLLYFDTNDNAYHLTTTDESPLIINGDVKVNLSSIERELDDYSTVLTSSDPITVFKTVCSNIKYMTNNTISDQSGQYVLLSLIVDTADDIYGLAKTKFNAIKDSMFVKVYSTGAITTYRIKDIPTNKISITNDTTTVYQIDLNDYISDSTLVQAVSLTYNTEIFIDKYNTNE